MLSLTINFTSYATNRHKQVILGGNTIGLKLDTGVFIAGKYQVEVNDKKISPWKNSDIKEGDKVVAYNNHKISSNNDILESTHSLGMRQNT